MHRWVKSNYILLSVLILTLVLGGCCSKLEVVDKGVEENEQVELERLDESAYYYKTEEVALYLYTYNKLPANYIKKSQANDMGWDSQAGNLWDVAEGMVIGGDNFGNREKLLPIKEGRKYFEADVNYQGGYRGPERIVYSNDGLIFYTADHYDSFEQLY